MRLRTPSSGKQTTNHIAFADRFYITHSNSSASAVPFEAVGGQVFIKVRSIIQDASITSADNAAITTAKIGTASVDTLQIAGSAVTGMAYGNGGPGSVPAGGATAAAGAYLSMPSGASGWCWPDTAH